MVPILSTTSAAANNSALLPATEMHLCQHYTLQLQLLTTNHSRSEHSCRVSKGLRSGAPVGPFTSMMSSSCTCRV
jgi:hypothetical protein